MMLMLFIILLVLLTFFEAIPIETLKLSEYERKRRKAAGDKAAAFETKKARALPSIISLQEYIVIIGIITSSLVAASTFGWLIGSLVSIFGVIISLRMSKLSFIRKMAKRLYEKVEPNIINTILKHSWLKWISSPVQSRPITLQSKPELLHLLDASGILTKNETRLVKHGLKFSENQVREIATPRSAIQSVKKSEILGPLVLDELHKTGHSRFPVIDSTLDKIIGTIHVRDILTLDTNRRHTAKAESAMDRHVYYISEDASLEEALATFLSTHHHMIIVVDDQQRTTGLLTLEDTIKALIGRKLNDPCDNRSSALAVSKIHDNINDESLT